MLTASERKLVDTVVKIAGGRKERIVDGIKVALIGENDRARRIYLWNILTKAAKAKIRRLAGKTARKEAQ